VEVENTLPQILGSAARLRQVVANLVDNAIKYTPAGGDVRVLLYRRDQQVVVEVTDTGVGIAPQDQEQLFQKFYRVHTPETAEIAGTGLGLALARSIVEQHDGRIWVRSAPGRGSTFAFSVPVPEDWEGGDSG
jgi:two-component system phosphate regulon sensor histidine kinase PhoR